MTAPGARTFTTRGCRRRWGAQVIQSETKRTRPLCVYPQIAKWNGSGSADDAANFSCVKPYVGVEPEPRVITHADATSATMPYPIRFVLSCCRGRMCFTM